MTAPDNAAAPIPPADDGPGNIPPGGSGPGNPLPGGSGPGNIPPGGGNPGRIILVLGGIRSGKSRFAEQLAAQLAGDTKIAPPIPDNPGADSPGLSDEATGNDARPAHSVAAGFVGGASGDAGGDLVGAESPAVGGGAAGGAVLYLATGVISDEAMAQRIAAHRARRPAHWLTLETPQHPAAALREYASAGWPGNGGMTPPVLLLDSVDGWIANLLLSAADAGGPAPGNESADADRNKESATASDSDKEAIIKEALAQTGALLHRLRTMPGHCILVSSEVGHSLVADTPLGRQFQDVLGLVNQELAAAAHQVYLAVAGLPLQIKPPPTHPGILP